MNSIPNIQEKINKLKNVSLFKEIKGDEESLRRIAELLATEHHEKGKPVISEGEDGDKLFIIKSGTVEIIKSTMQKDPYMVAKLSADMNVFFGEMALIDPDKRSASVVCATDCEFYVIKRDDFLELSAHYPAIGFAIFRELSKILCGRLRKANSDIICLFGALVEEVVESGGLSE
ncbi:MAG: cyclic nucleotide-binding domain-containing protein [Chitinivibrionales bacterium]